MRKNKHKKNEQKMILKKKLNEKLNIKKKKKKKKRGKEDKKVREKRVKGLLSSQGERKFSLTSAKEEKFLPKCL